MSNVKLVMYCGRKPKTSDRPNKQPNRIWHGAGSVVEVPFKEAEVLLGFKGQFEDVTNLDEDALAKRITEVKRSVKEELRLAIRPGVRVERGLRAADTKEIIEELASRGIDVTKLDLSDEDIDGQAHVQLDFEDLPAGPAIPKPEGDDFVKAIADATNTLANVEGAVEKHFSSKDGTPKVGPLSQILGFKVSKKEIDEALGG